MTIITFFLWGFIYVKNPFSCYHQGGKILLLAIVKTNSGGSQWEKVGERCIAKTCKVITPTRNIVQLFQI